MVMDGSAGIPGLTGRELVVHLFAPLTGPDTGAAAEYLSDVWRRCQRTLGMCHEVAALGLPTVPPHGWSVRALGEPDCAVLAACARRDNTGVYQAVLRRHHDAANLAVVLAPPAEEEASWTGLDEMWSRAAGESTATLLGSVRIYTGRVRGADLAELTTMPRTAEMLASALPATPLPVSVRSSDQAVSAPAPPAMMLGLAAWELDSFPDDRPDRRIVALGPEDADGRLSAWLWSRGTPEIPPFARYLLHAAKVRYHLRVWAGGRAVRRLRHDVDAMATALAQTLDLEPLPGPAVSGTERLARRRAEAEKAQNRLARLRAGQAHLIRTSTGLTRMRRSIDIARWNMGEATEGGTVPVDGLFRDDSRLMDWFLYQLDDDLASLEGSARRTREISDLARAHVQDLLGGYAGSDAGVSRSGRTGTALPHRPQRASDVDLTPQDRDILQRELAAVFSTGLAAAVLLDRVGLDRGLRLPFADHAPRDTWHAILVDLENGRVEGPHRRLLVAALAEFPFNEVFLDLAIRHGVSERPDD